jgi:hypothetical protein
LEIRASGGKTWYLRYTDARGRKRQLRIADARDLSLEQARRQADHLRGQIALGIDPAAEKATMRAVPTFHFVAFALFSSLFLPPTRSITRSVSLGSL